MDTTPTMTAPAAAPRIVEIISVTDTRAYVEDGDRFVPVPGSGDLNECARCRRMHEVHALVRLEDGTTAVVGTGCMGAESADVASKIRNAASRAKRIKIARAQIAKLTALVERRDAIRAAVAALKPPAIERAPLPAWKYLQDNPEAHRAWACGDAVVVVGPGECGGPASLCRRLAWAWARNREQEMGLDHVMERAAADLDEARRRLARMERAA